MSHSRARATRMPESPAASVRASHVALMPSPSQLLDLLPPAGAWTTEDYLWLTRDTNQLIELADGRLETLPMPTVTHQLVLKRLLWALDAYLQARGGLVLFAPLKLRLAPGDSGSRTSSPCSTRRMRAWASSSGRGRTWWWRS